MASEQLFGFFFIAFGAFISGSFSIPFDKVRDWKWENYWLIYALFAYIVIPLIACLILIPGFGEVYRLVPLSTLSWIFFLGLIYGVANLTFGLSLRYLGVSLGYALSLGLMMAIGTIVPPLIDGRLFQVLKTENGNLLLAGVLASALGIAVSGYAGFLKDKQVGNAALNKDFNFVKGLLAAVFVGVVGSSQALGIEQGLPIARRAAELGSNVLFQDSPVFLILYSGSFTATLVWCLYSSIRNKSVRNYVNTKYSLIGNYAFCALAGFLWYINYFFYGMGKNMMGRYTFTAWGITMTLTIVCAMLWGLYRGEWKGASPKVYSLMFTGITVLIVAAFMIGLSGS